MTDVKSLIVTFIIGILIPVVIYVKATDALLPGFWDNVSSEPWYVLTLLYALSAAIAACWIRAYNCILVGILLFFDDSEGE